MTTCRRCSECVGAKHHWMVSTVDPDRDDLDDTENVLVGDWTQWRADDPDNAPECPIYWTCKHCDHFERHHDECEDCGGPADADGFCLTPCCEEWPQNEFPCEDDDWDDV